MVGKVRLFDRTLGYGFIVRENGPDLFVHYTAILGVGFRALRKGDLVEFEIVEGVNGPQAVNVSVRPKPTPDRHA